jgi:hypothetical protein
VEEEGVSLRTQVGALILVSALLKASALPCSWAPGYFYQVTAIRGRVVGVNLNDSYLAPLQYWKWVRQRVRKSATISLYKYEFPPSKNRAPILTAKTDVNGWFELKDVKPGHFSINVKDEKLNGWFDVEVTDKAKPTDFINIDISLNFPDCKGGHEFEIHTKSLTAKN